MQLQEQLINPLTVVIAAPVLSGENNFLYSEIYEFPVNSQALFYLFSHPASIHLSPLKSKSYIHQDGRNSRPGSWRILVKLIHDTNSPPC